MAKFIIQGTPDSFIQHDFLDAQREQRIVDTLEGEIAWNPLVSLGHAGQARGRVGSFQGTRMQHGTVPYLRCPSIAQQEIMPFTPSIEHIRQRIVDQNEHDVNIAKIQKYEDGNSNIHGHADKIIDLKEGVPIYNARFGSTRIVMLTNKLDSAKQIRVVMKHNSLMILGPQTNAEWTHGVPATEDGTSTGASYSVIFRESVTFKHPDGADYLFGERTKFKTFEELNELIRDGSITKVPRPPYSELKALFAVENHNPVTLEHYRDFIDRSF
jgi:hypothetical protein